MNAATNQPSILTFRLGQSDRAGQILLLGPILVLLTLGISNAHFSPWVSYPLLTVLIIILVIGALPRVKGGFIGALWHIQK
ncbi:DUF983 domain-containing protein [Henriciella mobilis]|uniref:DUF983 domain-containing protein n=1 Tax=Henriciella mobilis TaxID=2305467 RepID=UPI000E65FABF|nr:DUF983 domain-containing protein [Henriciella mobilis]RIJ17028.1 DUF983 domain-containing protein [Henriciella mobilis]RIJ22830.1 DUF983 domain-containing protein [Henriciella mobilis]